MGTHLCYCESHTIYTHSSVTLYGKSHRIYTHLCHFVWEVTTDVHTPMLLCLGSHIWCTHTSVTAEVTLYIHTPLSLCMGSHRGYTNTSNTLYGKSHMIYTH